MRRVARPPFLSRPLRTAIATLLCAASVFAALPADAATYWTVPDLMKSFFASSKKVTYKRVSLADSEATDIAKRLGVESIKRDWLVYYGESDGRRDGYAIVDAEKGMHEAIDFAVRFTDGGAVARIEVMAYREAYGDEIRSARFRAQFSGKTASHAITAGKDIDIVSGASISCRSIAVGIKRDVLVLETALKNRSL